MKLISFEVNGAPSYGVVVGNQVHDLGLSGGPADLRACIEADEIDRLDPELLTAHHDLDAVRLLPVIPNPDKIICVGVNYATHLKETGREPPAYPMLFLRFASSQVGQGAPILVPPESAHLDFEGELAVVIGKSGRRIRREDAYAHVAGYSCYNDATIRDFQRHTSQFTPGKNFDNVGAFGPWLVTPDEFGDPTEKTYRTYLNGEVMQEAPISDLIFDIPALIEYISTFTTLLPGDVIVTGTTGGVGAFREPPVWMKQGDVVEVEIDGIGRLSNPIADEG